MVIPQTNKNNNKNKQSIFVTPLDFAIEKPWQLHYNILCTTKEKKYGQNIVERNVCRRLFERRK